MIRAIIFDCFGVLYHSSIDELHRLCPADRHDELHDVRLQRDRGYLNYQEYLIEVAKLLDSTYDQVKQITEESHVRNQGLIDYIRAVDRTRFKVGMLSNIGDTVIERLFSEDELTELFDSAALSYQVGMVKPDPAIFRLMADQIGCGLDECVMIDDIEDNCKGAEAVGMRSIHHIDTHSTLALLERMTTD